MRSFVVCTVLLAFVAASAQAGAVKSRRSDVEYSCDIKGIAALVRDVIADSVAVVFDVKADVDGISTGVLKCVSKDLTNPENLVNCVVDNVKEEANAAYNTVEQYLSDLKSSVEQLRTKINQCRKL